VKHVSIIIRLSTVSSLLVFLKKLSSLSESVTLEEDAVRHKFSFNTTLKMLKKKPHHQFRKSLKIEEVPLVILVNFTY
jgi:hypothetical protein